MKYKRFTLLLLAICSVSGVFSAKAVDAPSLGSNWPNSADVSRNVNHHVYRWQRQGITYVQVNAASGQPQMAIAYTAAGQLVLPVGDPDKVHVDLSTNEAPAGTQPLFDDGTVLIVEGSTGYSVISSPSSTSRIQAMDEATCNGDPLECTRVN